MSAKHARDDDQRAGKPFGPTFPQRQGKLLAKLFQSTKKKTKRVKRPRDDGGFSY